MSNRVERAVLVHSDNGIYTHPNRMDLVTRTLQTIDYVHHEIHAGSHYYISGYQTLNATEVFRVKMLIPDSEKWPHLTWGISSSGILETKLYEDAAGGMTGGASMTPLNSNRNSANTSGLVFTTGVTVQATLGLLISNAKWGATGKFDDSGGGTSREAEIILKQNTTYCRHFISGGASNIVQFSAHWYEHTNKDA